MSEHGHDDRDASHDEHVVSQHDSHGGGHDSHNDGDHDDHGHGGGEGDYNTLPPGPNMLPPVPAWGLALMAIVLVLLMGTIVNVSLKLADAGGHSGHGEDHGASSETHGEQSDKKAEH